MRNVTRIVAGFVTCLGITTSFPAAFEGAPDPGTAHQPSPLSPQEQQATFSLPPGFEIELVVSEEEGIGKFVTVAWDLKGRMWSMTALEYPVDANESPEVAKALYENISRDKVVVWDKPFSPGPHSARVFADGLAIPLGVLPYKNGVYVQHGSEIVFLSDTNSDGKADKREVILSGFGVQDSHLFPHQFTRAPGNWIWMAQGAFNYGKVRTSKGEEQQFDRTRMARFRYDGSEFDITSQGPCNIWGLVLNGEGESFIQEANDYGFPMMPFHEYANYPGCSDAEFKSYAPEFPGTAPHFQMGGTGLSGLALSDGQGAWPEPYAGIFYIANPITRMVQAIKVDRDGPRYRYEKLPDFIKSSDEMFRPVAIHFGPDGCLYIVDWYNKIISHNEVPRTHPERDKKRGRIWRVKHRTQTPFAVPDFTTLPPAELLAKLGGHSLAQSHLAWQAISDRNLIELAPRLKEVIADPGQPASKRIASLWALEGIRQVEASALQPMFESPNRNVRREAIRALGQSQTSPSEILRVLERFKSDPDPQVRSEAIRTTGRLIPAAPEAIGLALHFAQPSLPGPTARSTANGRTIKIGEAYDRDFERYLVRLFLERHPEKTGEFLDSSASRKLPLENRLLAALALEPRNSAVRVARLLPNLTRPPNEEELLRLAQFADVDGAGEALARTLDNPATRVQSLEALLKNRNLLNPSQVAPYLVQAVEALWSEDGTRDLSIRITSAFKLQPLEPRLVQELKNEQVPAQQQIALIRALRELGSSKPELFFDLAKNHPNRVLRNEAMDALATVPNDLATKYLIELWPEMTLVQRRAALNRLAGTKGGAISVLAALKKGDIPQADLTHHALQKLQVVLPSYPDLAAIVSQSESLFRPVLALDGSEAAWLDTDITLDGPFTLETWIKLKPGIDNNDGILGSPGVIDINFWDSQFRVWVGGQNDVIIANKKITPDTWTHLALTRDPAGKFRIYLNGELDSDKSQAAPQKFEHLRLAWTGQPKGTDGWLAEYRVWNRVRTPEEIRLNFDRSYEGEAKPDGLTRYFSGTAWPGTNQAAVIERTAEFPPLLTGSEARVQAEKFDQFRKLAATKGDSSQGKTIFATACISCHAVQGQGAQIGPVLNGAGAMGTEALLRAVLTPNAAMEAGYRTFRVELQDGELLDGLLVSQNDEAIILRRPNSEDQRIPQDGIRRAEHLRSSLMPEGLLESLNPQDVSDLFAYLATLK